MASTSAVIAQIPNLRGVNHWKNPSPSSFSFCKLNLKTNQFGMQSLSQSVCQKIGYSPRSLCIDGLFGGKKKGDDARVRKLVALDSTCIRKKYGVVSWSYLNPKEEFGTPCYDFLHKKNKLSGHIVSRSGLAGTGSPDAAFSLSERQLGTNVRGICFYAVSAISAIFLFVLMVLVHPFVLLLDRYQRKAHHLIAKIWATLTVIPFYDVKFEGLENLPSPDTPAVYVSNHQSFLDIYTLLTLGRSFKFVSKTAIFLIPIIGWAMYLLGTIPLKRMDSRSQLETLKRSINIVKKGASVFFFPEGTRSRDGKLGPFKKGAFSIAAKTRVPVVPITLIGTGRIMPAGMEGILNSGAVKVIIHKPIEGSDPEQLCNDARNIIADVLSPES